MDKPKYEKLTKDERLVKEFLESKDLKVEQYCKEKVQVKKPDFKVSTKDGFFFLCEVKSILTESQSTEGIKWSTIYNGISYRVSESIKQFNSANSTHSVPNVLFLISHNFQIHNQTIKDLFIGRFIIGDEVIADFSKYKYGEFIKSLPYIDLIIFLESHLTPNYFYTSKDLYTNRQLMNIFPVDPIFMERIKP